MLAKVALNAYLIPHHGVNGAAVAVIAGEAISIGVLTWGLLRTTPATGSGFGRRVTRGGRLPRQSRQVVRTMLVR